MSKKTILVICLLFLSVGCAKQNLPATDTPPSSAPQYNYTHQLQVGDKILMVEISTTQAQMQQGLSDRDSLEQGQGMLFDFSAGGGSASGGGNAAIPNFWMKDMKFDLDFIWIAGGEIIGITPNVSHPNTPNDPLPTYRPPAPVNQVLEVSAGWADRNKIKTGDEVRLK